MSDATTPFKEPEKEPTQEELEQAFFAELKEKFGPAAPDKAKMEAWKEQSGRVRWIEFGDDEIYFFRPFKSSEYKSWVKSLRNMQEQGQSAEEVNNILKERIVVACVLFPKIDPETVGAMYGGTVETLFEQIQAASNFISPEEAAMRVRQW